MPKGAKLKKIKWLLDKFVKGSIVNLLEIYTFLRFVKGPWSIVAMS